jgi:putative ABC transport system permease protein
MLLIGATLTLVGMVRLLNVDPGFDTKNLLTMRISLPSQRYGNDTQIANFHQEFRRRISSLPGVEGVSSISKLPLSGGGNTLTFQVKGQPEPAPGKEPEANIRVVGHDYFEIMGIPLRQGRGFGEVDHAGSPPVIVINETLARLYLLDENPVRSRLRFPGLDMQIDVVGVVGDVRIATLDVDPPPALYVSARQFPPDSTSFVIRTAGNPLALVGAVRAEMQQMDPNLPLYNIVTMQGLINGSRSVFLRKYLTFVLTTFSLVALVLGIVGIYGVLAHVVGKRHHEIGIRMALGAQRGDILKMVVGQGMLLVIVGVGIGLAGAFALTRFLESLLFGVAPTDPATFAGVSLLLAAVALLACYIPARRATRVDPMVALRYE